MIIDPLCPSNNVGSSTFALYKIKAAFDNSFSILTTTLGSFYCPSLLGRIINIAKSRSRLKYQKTKSTSEGYLGLTSTPFDGYPSTQIGNFNYNSFSSNTLNIQPHLPYN